MIRITVRCLLLILALSTPLLLSSCGGSEVIATTGGSEVIGTLVKTDNTPVPSIAVRALKISVKEVSPFTTYDTTIVGEDTTNEKGEFTLNLKDHPEEVYTLFAHYPGDSLVLPSHITFSPDPEKQLDLNTIVMRIPGSISGTVQLYGTTTGKPVFCYIAGTSLLATVNLSSDMTSPNLSTGTFFISNIPPDTSYTVTIYTEGFLPAILTDVLVETGTTRILLPILLSIDPAGLPPIPSNIKSHYDTLGGILHIQWEKVPSASVNRYIIQLFNNSVFSKDTVSDTSFSKVIFISTNDTVPHTVMYQLAALSDNNNSSLNSKIDTLIAPPPSVLGFTMSIAQGSTVPSADSIPVILTFDGSLRSAAKIAWWVDHPDSIVKTVADLSSTSGVDTLYWNSKTDKNTLGVTLTDNSGTTWIDSIDASTLLPINVWATGDSLLEERRYAGACVVAGSIYVFGGCKEKSTMLGVSLTGLSTTEYLRTPGGTWEKRASMNHPRYNAAYTEFEGMIYVFGGTCGANSSSSQSMVETTVEVYDPATDIWTVIDTMEQSVIGAAACKLNDVIIITGGMSGSMLNPTATSAVLSFNPRDASWSTLSPMSCPRLLHKALPVDDMTLLIVGGINFDGSGEPFAVFECEYFRTSAATSTTTSPISLKNGSVKLGAAVVQNNLFVFGGLAKDGIDDTPLSSVDVFSLETGSDHAGAPLINGIEGMSAVSYENRIYCIGGTSSSGSRQKSSKAVYVYYP